uniref:Uncharacterized protein n=1 Tax=uncultured bacterium fCS1 TaxID=585280 RepID=C3U0P9_9BACT|nr:hypothetical protein [uncultured bacterium fCS1]
MTVTEKNVVPVKTAAADVPQVAAPAVLVKPVVAKPVVAKTATRKPVATKSTAAKPAAKAAPKSAPKAKKPAAPKPATKPVVAKPAKAKKPKMVRDSFTMPKPEYVVMDTLKLRAAKLTVSVKKTELLRAGIKALAAMADAAFLAAVQAVPNLKTGRPAKSKAKAN